MSELLNDEIEEELDEEESEWERQKRYREDMNQRFDKLFSLFPDAIAFDLSCCRHWDFHRPYGTKQVRVSATNNHFKSSHIVSGEVMIHHHWNKPMDIEIIGISKQEYGSTTTDINDEDAKELIITAVKAVVKTDADERVEVKRRGKTKIYSVDSNCNPVVEERENKGYSLTVPVVEIKHYNSNTFEWLED